MKIILLALSVYLCLSSFADERLNCTLNGEIIRLNTNDRSMRMTINLKSEIIEGAYATRTVNATNEKHYFMNADTKYELLVTEEVATLIVGDQEKIIKCAGAF
ncbi:MAG TPA: hypothetical protein DCE80_03545 [Ignavibacteriales bacterium]|nr:hypothetical protein [Ignavibacteriales bacterium]